MRILPHMHTPVLQVLVKSGAGWCGYTDSTYKTPPMQTRSHALYVSTGSTRATICAVSATGIAADAACHLSHALKGMCNNYVTCTRFSLHRVSCWPFAADHATHTPAYVQHRSAYVSIHRRGDEALFEKTCELEGRSIFSGGEAGDRKQVLFQTHVSF